jgi:hypothetical protein
LGIGVRVSGTAIRVAAGENGAGGPIAALSGILIRGLTVEVLLAAFIAGIYTNHISELLPGARRVVRNERHAYRYKPMANGLESSLE